jgi:hypothetical protein
LVCVSKLKLAAKLPASALTRMLSPAAVPEIVPKAPCGLSDHVPLTAPDDTLAVLRSSKL